MTTAITALPFMGETLSCFDPSDNTVTETTAGGSFDPTWSTCAIFISGSGGTPHASSPTWPVASTFWAHAVAVVNPAFNGVGDSLFCQYFDGATEVARVTVNNAGNYVTDVFKVWTLQSGVLTEAFAVNVPGATRETVDFQFVGDTASGIATMFVAGTQQAQATGLNHSGWTGITQMKLWGGFAEPGAPGSIYWSQVIADASPTVGRNVYHERINTYSATNTGWGGVVGDINEIPTNDSNPIISTAASQISTFYQSPAAVLTGRNILAVGVGARMRVQGSGPPNIELALRSGGSNFTSATIAAGAGFQAAFNSWTADPATAVQWTPTGATTAEKGVESSS